MKNPSETSRTIVFDGCPLRIEDIGLIAAEQAQAELSRDPAFIERIDKGARFIDKLLSEQGFVYGVTTGFGEIGRAHV